MRWISRLALPFILAVTTWCASNLQWGGDRWKGILEADAKGYYAYLPAAFIYHDLNFGFRDAMEKQYGDTNLVYEYRTGANGKVIDKYFAGTAVAEAPFFLLAHLMSKIAGQPADGYSKFYPIFINIGALVYLFIGLVFIRNLLRSFQVSDLTIAFIQVVLVFGTNLFYYAVVEPGMSHIYSFTFITMFVYYARKYFITFQAKNILYCAALLGITVLIRPVNGLVIFALPFIAGSSEKFREGLRNLWSQAKLLAAAGLLCLLIIFIQPFYYLMACGRLFVYSYGDETFNWLHPQLFPFLFGFKKGVFVYAPLLFFALAGFIYLWKKDRYRFYSLLLFSVILVYALSSWWNWWYGGSFGSRVMMDFYVFDALLLGFAFKLFEKRPLKIVYAALLVLPVLLCIAQTYQYRYGIIHWENMDAQKYWEVFLDFRKITG